MRPAPPYDRQTAQFQVTGADNTAGAIDTVNTGIAGVVKGQNDYAAAKLTNITNAATAVKACKDALAAQQALGASASDEDKVTAKALVDLANQQAISAYAAAGLPFPAPGPCESNP
jgi:hypothetical protein